MRIVILFFILSTVCCGYGLRGTERSFMSKNQIKTIQVATVQNNSYKAGIDLTVYNALRKRIASGGYVRLVDKPELADAILNVSVQTAAYAPLAVTRADQLAPLATGPSSVQVATSYLVNLDCEFTLEKRSGGVLWKNSFHRSKSFSASTYLGVLGSTSALINESEFEKTLASLSDSLVVDADETMNSQF